MNTFKTLWLAGFLLGSTSVALAAENPWQVVESRYSPIIQKIEANWPIQGLSELSEQKETLKIEGVITEGSPFFIGVVQMTSIKAPLQQVADFLDHFLEYPKYFKGLKKTEILESKIEENQSSFRIFFEQGVPIPLVPNDKSEIIYTVKSKGTSQKIYRYQLHQGNNLISNDGIIILDAISSRLTRYVEIDFWDANWGIAKAVGAKKIWEDSIRGLIQTDYAIKLKSENPTWSEDRVVKESEKYADEYPFESRYVKRLESQAWLKAHGLDLKK